MKKPTDSPAVSDRAMILLREISKSFFHSGLQIPYLNPSLLKLLINDFVTVWAYPIQHNFVFSAGFAVWDNREFLHSFSPPFFLTCDVRYLPYYSHYIKRLSLEKLKIALKSGIMAIVREVVLVLDTISGRKMGNYFLRLVPITQFL